MIAGRSVFPLNKASLGDFSLPGALPTCHLRSLENVSKVILKLTSDYAKTRRSENLGKEAAYSRI
jgi:hypothetical protein